MINKLTSTPFSEMIEARLKVMLEPLNTFYQNNEYTYEDDLSGYYNEIVSSFLESIGTSIVGTIRPIVAGMPTDPVDYNLLFSAIDKDLRILFAETGEIDKLISANFNTVIALREKLLDTERKVASKVGDFSLYANPSSGIGFFFGDGFNSSLHLDIGSSLLSKTECLLNQEEGVILLPLDGSPTKASVSKYIINAASNGIAGNNQQADALPHNKIEVIGDGQPDSWFEYERVSQDVSSSTLILDLTLVLSEATIINHIHINPLQFGTATPVFLSKVETSLDGAVYFSIKEEVPISDFMSEIEEEVFTLSGKTSKYSGEGFYSFLPRRAKFIHLVFEQNSPYEIENSSGVSLLRYAIGIRDIDVYSRKFQKEGELISSLIDVGDPITKVSIWASENPTEVSTLADIKHEISHDDGATWLAIQPQGRDYSTYPEVININNSQSGSVQTSTEITSLRHKITMTRYPEAFSGNVVLKSDKLYTTEITSLPGQTPFKISLQNKPVKDSIDISLPLYGSFSCPRGRSGADVIGESPLIDLGFIEFNVDNASTDTVRFKLPFKSSIKNLEDKIRVFVNGEQWGYSSKSVADLTSLDETSRVYFLNNNGMELQFVHLSGDDKYGKIPGAGARIQICLDGDNPPLEKGEESWLLNLSEAADGFDSNMYVVTPTALLANVDETSTIVEPDGTYEKVVLSAGKVIDNLNVAIATQSKTKVTSIGEKGRPGFYSSINKRNKPNYSINLSSLKKKDKSKAPSLLGSGLRDTAKYLFSSMVSKADFGWLPPVYDLSAFVMKELSPATGLPLPGTSALRQFHNTDDAVAHVDGYVAFVDGSSELYNGTTLMTNRYTFNPRTGKFYFGHQITSISRVEFYFKYREFKVLDSSEWSFYKDKFTGKIDLTRLSLSPSAIKQFDVSRTVSAGDKSVQITDENIKAHDWWKQKIIPGTIKTTPGLVAEDIKLIEVPYVDGYTELSNTKVATYTVASQSSNGTKTFTIPNITTSKPIIGSLAFTRSIVYPAEIKDCQFVTEYADVTSLSEDGDWFVDRETGEVTVVVSDGEDIGLGEHVVKYEYEDLTTGIDRRGFYSVDYDNGTLYFATAVLGGTVTAKVSMYSAFYNISELVREEDIQEVNEEGKTIELKPSFGVRFIGNTSVSSLRPKFVRVGYGYYNSVQESLKDLEPYFSPICKDFALKAITTDMIGEV
jgi:hypothetical protein